MKKQVLFIHSAGAQGYHQGSSDLAAHLQDALGIEYNVLYPIMPNPENPAYKPWKDKLKEELDALQGEVLLIGHSLGGSVLLKYLSEETCQKTIAGLFLIATPFWGVDEDWQVDEFVLRKDFSSKITQIPRIFLFHSHDDEIVPFRHLQLYAKHLPNATVRALHNYGHAFKASCRELIHDIKTL